MSNQREGINSKVFESCTSGQVTPLAMKLNMQIRQKSKHSRFKSVNAANAGDTKMDSKDNQPYGKGSQIDNKNNLDSKTLGGPQ